MKSVFFGLTFFAIVSVGAQTDSELIRESRSKSNQAIARHDTSALASFWLHDLIVITSRNAELHGKQINQRAFQQDFDAKEDLLYVRNPTTVEVFPNWNMAAEYGQWTGTWKSNNVAIKIGGSYYAKWHKVDGAWKIRSETFTPLFCDGGDYCRTLSLQNTATTIVVQNLYYPKAGKEKEVLETRQRASEVRAKLGLPVGRILLRTSESSSQPYIIWECEYHSLKAREDDVAALDRSEEFTKVQQHMGTLLEKFDRSMWQVEK
jgi:ketosteroid isomerase-like protein